MNKNDIERFWSRVNKNTKNGCWEWVARLNPDGYGEFDCDNRGYRAHRLSWFFKFGEIEKGLNVCHKCDNPKCVNPDHLFLGTQKENVMDMLSKNRQRSHKGTKNNKARLNEEKVSEIKRLRRSGLQYKEIADKFGVSVGCVSHILNGRHWTWVK